MYLLILVTSLLNGLGEGLAQTAAGKYVSDCATEEIKGLYFSIFWSSCMGSQIFGSLISAFVLGNFNQVAFVVVMAVVAILATLLLFFIKKP